MARATAIANAVRKLAAGLSAHRDVSGCYAVLALAVERLGDPASAATIREMVSKTMRFGDASSVSGVVQRYEPTELDGELVLDGEAGKTLRALARDLSIAHRFVAAHAGKRGGSIGAHRGCGCGRADRADGCGDRAVGRRRAAAERG